VCSRGDGELTLSLRPEKIDLRDAGQAGLQGKISQPFLSRQPMAVQRIDDISASSAWYAATTARHR
jgi:hypothetical protein